MKISKWSDRSDLYEIDFDISKIQEISCRDISEFSSAL